MIRDRIGLLPEQGLFLTAWVDVRKDRIEVEVVAWGRNKESWSIDYRAYDRQPGRRQTFEQPRRQRALLDRKLLHDHSFTIEESPLSQHGDKPTPSDGRPRLHRPLGPRIVFAILPPRDLLGELWRGWLSLGIC
jgi:Phage terminase large subunit (GpA)